MAHGSLGEELSTTATEELELLSEEESEDSEGAGLWQNLGPMIILVGNPQTVRAFEPAVARVLRGEMLVI